MTLPGGSWVGDSPTHALVQGKWLRDSQDLVAGLGTVPCQGESRHWLPVTAVPAPRVPATGDGCPLSPAKKSWLGWFFRGGGSRGRISSLGDFAPRGREQGPPC